MYSTAAITMLTTLEEKNLFGEPIIEDVDTDHAIQYDYKKGKLIALNHDDGRFSASSSPYDYPGLKIKYMRFPDITGCHIVLAKGQTTNTIWLAHVSAAQASSTSVPSGFREPPPPYAQLLSENYNNDGIGINEIIDIIIIDKAHTFKEETFRKKLGGCIGTLKIIRPEKENTAPIDIYYDLELGAIIFVKLSENSRNKISIFYSDRALALHSNMEVTKPTTISTAAEKYFLNISIENGIPLLFSAIASFKSVEDLLPNKQYFFNILKTYIKFYLEHQHNVAEALLQTSILLIGDHDAHKALKKAAIDIVHYTATHFESKRSAFYLAECFAGIHQESEVQVNAGNAKKYLSLAKQYGSSTASSYLDLLSSSKKLDWGVFSKTHIYRKMEFWSELSYNNKIKFVKNHLALNKNDHRSAKEQKLQLPTVSETIVERRGYTISS